VLVECPAADNTYYVVPGTNQRFLRKCDTNYLDDGIPYAGSTANSMTDCLSLCAKYNTDPGSTEHCAAVTWSYVGPQGTGANYCYPKKTGNQTNFHADVESGLLVN
jgi:hypothetical protein